MHGWKGQHVTARAFLKLANSGATPVFSLLFLGEGSADYKEKVQSILNRAPKEWRDAVRFARFAADDFSFIDASDIVVHPSVLPDPLPNAVREAMILGKAVIASRCGGIPEMIRAGETGLLVEPNDADALSEAMNKLITSPGTRRRLGQAAQRFAIAHFDSDSCMQEYYRLLLDITGQRRECSA
jgi:glycosyltransferase involved in cell wall biosynthesis